MAVTRPHHPLQLFILLSTLLLLVYPAHAVRMQNLYEAAVPVADQSPDTRKAALREILRSVVVKVTGQGVIPNSFFQPPPRMDNLVEQFGYESRSVENNNQRQLYLWSRLNPVRVKQLIRQAGLPIWPEERPATLVWLAVDDTADRQILAEGDEHIVLDSLQLAAEHRGLPIVLPLMDLEESSMVEYESIAAMQMDPLRIPSGKYASHHVLVGHIQRVDKGLWRARWKLMGEDEQVITTPVGPLADIVASGINPLASRIAGQFSSVTYIDSEQYIDLAIDDINGAADYARSLNYLESLSLVSQVDVVGVQDRKVNFRLHTKADLASVLQVIDLGRVLYARDTIDQLVFGLNP